MSCGLRVGAYIVAAYVLSHGLTAWLVTPLQERLLPELTVFASLIYLPHGVRVLTAWLCGWRAALPLFMGAVAAELLFTPLETRELLRPVIVQSLLVGAFCAPVALAVLRGLSAGGRATPSLTASWRWLLGAGVLASVLNSVGQTFVFSGYMTSAELSEVVVLYALGDVIGLVVSTLVLMSIFRWMRLGIGR